MRGLRVVAMALVVITACGDTAGETPAIDVARALAMQDGEIRVHGQIHVNDRGRARLCFSLSVTDPPDCVGAPLTLEGLDDVFVHLNEEPDGTFWSEEVTIEGTKEGRTVQVESLVHGVVGGSSER